MLKSLLSRVSLVNQDLQAYLAPQVHQARLVFQDLMELLVNLAQLGLLERLAFLARLAHLALQVDMVLMVCPELKESQETVLKLECSGMPAQEVSCLKLLSPYQAHQVLLVHLVSLVKRVRLVQCQYTTQRWEYR